MGFFSKLFGGGKTEIKSKSTMNRQQRELLNAIAPWMRQRIGQGLPGFGPISPYRAGESMFYTMPLSPYERTGLSTLSQYMGSTYNPVYGGALRDAVSGLSPDYMENFYRTNILPRQERLFSETVLPRVREAYVRSGNYWGTPRMESESLAAQRFGEFTGSELAKYIMEGREQGLRALPTALAASQWEESVPLRKAQAAMTLGALPRQLQQAEFAARMGEFVRTTPELNPIIDRIMQLLNIQTKAYYGQQPGEGYLSQAIGGLAPIAGLAAGIATGNPMLIAGGGLSTLLNFGGSSGSGGVGGISPYTQSFNFLRRSG